jgi:hypothetical protein
VRCQSLGAPQKQCVVDIVRLTAYHCITTITSIPHEVVGLRSRIKESLMMANSGKVVGLTVAVMLLVAGCSKNESSPTETQSMSPPLPNIVFKGPGSSANDPSLLLMRSYVSTLNSFAITLAPLAFSTPVQTAGTWTWTNINKTLTLVLTASTQNDGTYLWKLVFDGVDPTDGTAYDHWLGVDGTSSADGKTGSGKTYVRNKTQVSSEFNWATTNNILTGTLKPYINGIAFGQTVVVNNPDNSGELRVYTGSFLVYKAVWQTNGSGQWWSYDANGIQIGTGTWT